MARASTPTLLSLQRFANVVGIPPVHFAGAFGDVIWSMKGACEEVWPQYSWQKNMEASREDLALAIANAEEDIARHLGYWPAPKWIAAEEYLWPRPGYIFNNNIRTRYGKIIGPGKRALTLLDADAPVVYSDVDVDDWDEIATITASTTVTDVNEIKIYFAGHAGDPAWEIRPVKSITITGGVVTIKANSWLFIDPVLWEVYPTNVDFVGVNVTTTDNYVTAVDVYREYTNTDVSVEHWWLTGNCGIEVDERQVSDSKFVTIAPDAGWVRPIWDEDMLCTHDSYPDGGKLWYRAGDISDRYVSGETLDPLSDYWAQAIVWLSTARLERPPCSCGPAQAYFNAYRRDLAYIGTDRTRQIVTQELLNTSAFGTRMGEVRAWERVSKFNLENNMFKGAAI